MEVNAKKLVADYEINRPGYESFARIVSSLIERLLAARGIVVHSNNFRCKTLKSFAAKVDGKAKYESLDQITDLSGVRLITHYEDDVDRVAEIIASEFSVDLGNSIDKRKTLEPSVFGYLSLHYVVSLNEERAELLEYSAYRGMKVEVQIRSILQHTWAEIEHDTGYKTVHEIPKHIRRRFARLAGLLEIADHEFMGIRDALFKYSKNVELELSSNESSEEAANASVDSNHGILLDKVSLEKFVELDGFLYGLDGFAAGKFGAKLGTDINLDGYSLLRLQRLNILDVAGLVSALYRNAWRIKSLAEYWAGRYLVMMGGKGLDSVDRGISLTYLVLALLGENGDRSFIDQYLKEYNLLIDEDFVEFIVGLKRGQDDVET